MFILSSVNAMDLDWNKMLLFCKGFNEHFPKQQDFGHPNSILTF